MTWQLFIAPKEPGLSKKSKLRTYQIDPIKTYKTLITFPVNEGIPLILKTLVKEGEHITFLLKPLCAPEYAVWYFETNIGGRVYWIGVYGI